MQKSGSMRSYKEEKKLRVQRIFTGQKLNFFFSKIKKLNVGGASDFQFSSLASSSAGHKVRVMMIFFWLEKFDDKNEVPWPTFSNLFFSSNNFKRRRRRRVRPFEEDLRQQQPAVFPSPISTTNFSYPLKNLATKDRLLSCKNKILFFKSKIDSISLVSTCFFKRGSAGLVFTKTSWK